MAKQAFISCVLKQLPEELWVAAALTAAAENPANAPAEQMLAALIFPVEPQHIAVMTSKWWGAKGVDLSVQFLDSPNAETRRRILEQANRWSKYAKVQFRETAGQGDLRIARARGDGYWSYLGTDNRMIAGNQATMNLEGFTERTPEAEYLRVVPHEFGHALGCPHEHARRAIVERLDPAKTIAVFQRDYGWSASTTRQQVLTPLDERSVMGTPPDETSIMTYQFSGECTRDGKPITGGLDMNESDLEFLGKAYPKPLPPPPPPPPPAGKGLVSVDTAARTVTIDHDWTAVKRSAAGAPEDV